MRKMKKKDEKKEEKKVNVRVYGPNTPDSKHDDKKSKDRHDSLTQGKNSSNLTKNETIIE